MLTVWLGFFIAMIALLVISQKNLGIAMLVGALILGVFSIPEHLAMTIWLAAANPSTILLAIVVGLIPIIGGTLKATGQMDNLVSNMRIGKKAFLMISPALVGLLPMPGGALLSAPLIEKGAEDVPRARKAGLNVWFRHILYLIYPLSPTLIISSEAAQLDVYQVIPYLAPAFLFSLVLGYFFFLRDTPGEMDYKGEFSLRKLLPPLIVLVIAPILDLSIKTFLAPTVEEIATMIAVSTSLVIAVAIGRTGLRNLGDIAWKARPWNFALMIVGIMVFLNVFQNSGILQLIENVYITQEILLAIGFLLGFGTGRIITPAGIIFPIFIIKFGNMSLATFAIMYFSIFLGYVLTPVHPCVSLSVESFKVEIRDYFKAVLQPALIALIVSLSLLYAVNM